MGDKNTARSACFFCFKSPRAPPAPKAGAKSRFCERTASDNYLDRLTTTMSIQSVRPVGLISPLRQLQQLFDPRRRPRNRPHRR